MSGQVFVSYARADFDAVQPWLDRLAREGVDLWLDQDNLNGASLWAGRIVQAIEQGSVVMVMVSKASVESPHVCREVHLADKHGKGLIPLVLQPDVDIHGDLEYFLSSVQHIPLHGRDEDAVVRDILDALERRGVPTTTAAVPSVADDDADVDTESRVTLTVVEGQKAGTEFTFDRHDTFIFGRASNGVHCRITGDDAVSRYHFLLECNPPEAQLRDLGSTNGTVVNGVKYRGMKKKSNESGVSASVRLADGDEIRVGRTRMEISVIAPETAEPPEALDAETVEEDDIYSEMTVRQAPPPQAFAETADASTPEAPEEAVDASTGPDPRLSGLIEGFLDMGGDGGVRIPGYRLMEQLGEGSVGVVHLAEHEDSGERFAVKIVPMDSGLSRRVQQSFLREVQLTRELAHDHIITFHDCGFCNGVFYFVLEYAIGGSVEALLERSPENRLPPETAVGIMTHALRGMVYAHSEGVVHRDIKPANILLLKNGRRTVAKVSDLGFAKPFDAAGLSGFTATGDSGGTPAYMPREQLTDFRDAKPASDVFALGATLYTMLSGESVYRFEKHGDPIAAILSGDVVALRERCPDLPTGLTEVVDTATALAPKDRYPSASEMLAALGSAR